MEYKKDQHSYPIYFPANPYIIPSQPSLQSRWQNIMIFLVLPQRYCNLRIVTVSKLPPALIFLKSVLFTCVGVGCLAKL